MENYRALVLLCISALLVGATPNDSAQNSGRVASLRVVRESIAPQATSADPRLAGVMGGALDRRIQRPTLYVFGVRAADRALCIRIKGMDGAYEMTMVAELQRGGSGTERVTIDFSSLVRYPRATLNQLPAQFAIRALAAPSAAACDQQGELLVASWQPEQPAVVSILFLASKGSGVLSVGAGRPRNCSSISELAPVTGQRTSFDRACQIAAPACNATVRYEVQRTDDLGGALSPIPARFRAPC